MVSHEQTGYDSRPTSPDRLLTINDVAFTLAISRDSVYRLVRGGSLHPVRVGERLRFRQEDLDAYLERGTAP